MSFLLKSMVSSQVKNLGLGGGEEEKKDDGAAADPAAAAGMTREEYEEYQKQVVEENPQRALCVRGPLANNGKRNHREYPQEGKQFYGR
ncbi:UNVERIFIED_CONTAM: hypothetical protein FKN15_049274 [Acipenser sinensis]